MNIQNILYNIIGCALFILYAGNSMSAHASPQEAVMIDLSRAESAFEVEKYYECIGITREHLEEYYDNTLDRIGDKLLKQRFIGLSKKCEAKLQTTMKVIKKNGKCDNPFKNQKFDKVTIISQHQFADNSCIIDFKRMISPSFTINSEDPLKANKSNGKIDFVSTAYLSGTTLQNLNENTCGLISSQVVQDSRKPEVLLFEFHMNGGYCHGGTANFEVRTLYKTVSGKLTRIDEALINRH